MPLKSQFQAGDAVRVLRPIRNDGTYPGKARGELLIRRGSKGVVQDVGTFLQDQIIYAVLFIDENRIVGCREEEVQAAGDPWIAHRFDSRDRVRAAGHLSIGGEIRARAGDIGQVMKVLNQSEPVQYQVIFGDRILQLPETLLTEINPDADAGLS
ncbi:nitrogen fixation protein NifZ [Formivibrio citricus]|uniref:Nitrogen fixation protein NifZ n=1 Tax=Formivibrio citricus TaxID=83765 RepID=A0A1I4YZ42_9NEIS|nr:nitrogen fixation protein NifZ [Formivibrio citricus]SFN43272.1 nitrogen fixation protein NifZ [Formivibrio citricus]